MNYLDNILNRSQKASQVVSYSLQKPITPCKTDKIREDIYHKHPPLLLTTLMTTFQ